MIRAFDLLPWNRHKRWRRDVSAVLDGALSTPERERLQAHLATCDGCRDFDRDLRATQASLASLRDVEAPRSFRLTPAMVAAPARPPERARSSALMRGAQLATALAVIGLAVVSIVDFSDSGTKHSANSTTSLAAAAPQGAKSAPLNDAAGGAGFGSAPEDNHAPQPAGTTAPATPTGGNVVVPTPRGPNSAGTGCDAAQPLNPNSPATTSPPTPCASPSSAEATSKAGTAPPAETPAPNDSAPTQRQQSNTAEPAIAPATTATTTAKAGWYRPAELGLGIVAAIAAVAVIVLAFRTREP